MQNQHFPLPQEVQMGQYPTLNQSQVQVMYPNLAGAQYQVGQPIGNGSQIATPQPQTGAHVVQMPVYAGQVPYSTGQNPQTWAQQPNAIQVHPTSRHSQVLTCFHCQRQVQTVVNHQAGNGAYVMGGIMAAVGLWLGCCLIPCMMEDCKDAVHFCPQCTSQLGRKKFLFE